LVLPGGPERPGLFSFVSVKKQSERKATFVTGETVERKPLSAEKKEIKEHGE